MTLEFQETMRYVVLRLVVLVIASWMLTPLDAQAVDFDKQIAPILASHCLECHRGDEPEGGLSLTELALVKKAATAVRRSSSGTQRTVCYGNGSVRMKCRRNIHSPTLRNKR